MPNCFSHCSTVSRSPPGGNRLACGFSGRSAGRTDTSTRLSAAEQFELERIVLCRFDRGNQISHCREFLLGRRQQQIVRPNFRLVRRSARHHANDEQPLILRQLQLIPNRFADRLALNAEPIFARGILCLRRRRIVGYLDDSNRERRRAGESSARTARLPSNSNAAARSPARNRFDPK